jgi:dihydrofolate synthase/folylpolyglutamate synthase
MEYKESLEFIYSRERFGIKLGLQNIRTLLQGLSEPHKSYPAVLIAGTNGKGSTASMIASILIQAGYRVGLYTSPHLVRLEERFQINYKMISSRELVFISNKLKSLIESLLLNKKLIHQPTFFEVTTAIALEYFKQKSVDIALLEVGMGGRLDATNAVDPLLSVITNIGIDHWQYLGEGIKNIAQEKAGIIRNNGYVVIGHSPKEALDIIVEVCKRKKAHYILSFEGISDVHPDKDFHYEFKYVSSTTEYPALKVGLKGKYQVENAAAAICAIELLSQKGFEIRKKHIKAGLESPEWPGRLELIHHSPQIWLDGAHNVTAAISLKEFIQQNIKKRVILIFSALSDKDIKGLCQVLFPLAKLVIVPQLQSERGEKPERIVAQAPANSPALLTAVNTEKAVRLAVQKSQDQDVIVIAGSLYLVGEIKSLLQHEIINKHDFVRQKLDY